MMKTYDKNTGDQSVRVETVPKEFGCPFAVYRSMALQDLKTSLAYLLSSSSVSDHDVGRIRGSISSYYCCELITESERDAFSLVVTTFHFSEFSHSSHVVSYLATRC
ncbi:hypothetical protein ACPC5U_13305 [Acinetobacter haemolyticus]|uniref:hypothetical protein n=1 Tax=Acinetobacter haemolyticus TaxID=29430 RepID=UPI003C22D178